MATSGTKIHVELWCMHTSQVCGCAAAQQNQAQAHAMTVGLTMQSLHLYLARALA